MLVGVKPAAIRHAIAVIPVGPPPNDATTGGAVIIAMGVAWSKKVESAGSPRSSRTRVSQTPYQRSGSKRQISPAPIEKTRLFQTPTTMDDTHIGELVKLSVNARGENATLSI